MLAVEEKKSLIEETLAKIIPEQNVPWNILYEAARYSLLNGGKRLRPILTLTVAEALGGAQQDALHPACAIELIHTYSLIHDDLPAMDNDDFRRGKPSLHKAYPEGHAILAGDYLLTLAFETLTKSPGLTDGQKLSLIEVLSDKGGGKGMIGGQILDLEGGATPLETIHQMKTGALISAACEFGAIASGYPNRRLLALFGEKIGLAFQIIDDLLDADNCEKVSYVAVKGENASRTEAQRLLDEAIDLLDPIAGKKPLIELARTLVQRNY